MTTTYVLVHGAWHGPWAWERIVPLLHAAGARTVTPDLGAAPGDHGPHDHGPHDHGLHDDARTVVAALDAVPEGDDVVLVGHSYAGLVVREAADARPDAVGHLVLVDGWAGPDGAALLDLAPDSFGAAMRKAAAASPDGRTIPAPPPAAFGVTDAADTAWLAPRLVPQPLRTFTEASRLRGAVDSIPGTAVHCRPVAYPFDRFGAALGYRSRALDGPHNVMLTDPEPLARLLLEAPA